MWSHCQVTGVSIDHRWRHLGVGVDIAINAVAYPQEVGGNADGNILALLNGAGLVDSADHDSAVDAIADFKELNIRVDVNVRILAALDTQILVLHACAVFNGHALAETVHVLNLAFGLMLEYDLAQPVDDHVHVNLHLVASLLEEGCQLAQLHGASLQT